MLFSIQGDEQMNIKWTDVLMYSSLKEAKVVAGVNGLNREIRLISVYDCEQAEDFNADESGVLYITTFGQFKNSPHAILPWVTYLNKNKVSGLCTISDMAEALDDEVIQYCNENAFPIISVERDVTYAEIIDNVSSLLHFNNLHVVNEKRIDNVLNNKLRDKELMEEVRGINPNFKKKILIHAIKGDLESIIFTKRMDGIFDEAKEDMYIRYKDLHLLILSSEEDVRLDRKSASILSLIKPYFTNPIIGEGKKYDLQQFDRAITTAQKALVIALASNSTYVVYDDFSDVALLLPLKDSEEARAFYLKFKELLDDKDVSDKMHYIECIRCYVEAKGEWAEVAKKLFQSENTIRYRINKIKGILGLEDDTIKFHEIISIFVTIEDILGGKKEPEINTF
jgi:hypothetical protein